MQIFNKTKGEVHLFNAEWRIITLTGMETPACHSKASWGALMRKKLCTSSLHGMASHRPFKN